ncbi:hypothetical protein K1T71_000731 [Dendrolimus kikuchii]|uniref:Uncharacterized protein n=1 Tax=Dendrolimus kikuchii TaxID=765133 RepID=A0ACC1DK18_9NEOP|nr:hypothetical protein K1T71_000731 [Dendrolimus kikuchii]
MLNLSNDIIQDCNRRIDNITYIRVDNMETASFEVGYITYVLQEKYRHMVDKYNSSYFVVSKFLPIELNIEIFLSSQQKCSKANMIFQEKSRRVGVELLTLDQRRQGPPHDQPPVEITPSPADTDDNNMRMKLFRLMYETVRDSDLKFKRAELIKTHYSNSSTFDVGYIMGEVTDKFNIISDISATLKRLYHEWTPIEHINAYEQIANQAIEISHLIDIARLVSKRNKASL